MLYTVKFTLLLLAYILFRINHWWMIAVSIELLPFVITVKFTLLLLAYALFRINHWWMIAVSIELLPFIIYC